MTKLKTTWVNSGQAFGYTVSIGISPAEELPSNFEYYETRQLNNASTGVEFELDTRGYWYHLRVIRKNLNGYQDYATHRAYLPTCEERETWQAAHPEYTEPLEFKPFNY
jgi:hypothetical protein